MTCVNDAGQVVFSGASRPDSGIAHLPSHPGSLEGNTLTVTDSQGNVIYDTGTHSGTGTTAPTTIGVSLPGTVGNWGQPYGGDGTSVKGGGGQTFKPGTGAGGITIGGQPGFKDKLDVDNISGLGPVKPEDDAGEFGKTFKPIGGGLKPGGTQPSPTTPGVQDQAALLDVLQKRAYDDYYLSRSQQETAFGNRPVKFEQWLQDPKLNPFYGVGG